MDVVKFLSEIVQLDSSINPNEGVFPDSSTRDLIAKMAIRLGFEQLPLRKCIYPKSTREIYPLVVYKKGTKEGKKVLFLGHIDVVPVPEDEQWDHAAFSGTVQDDLLYGRGSSDMKGGVAAFFKAFENKIDAGTVIIALSGDEEVGGMASMPVIVDALRENDLLPDYVINAEPSRNNIIVTQRRGGTWLRYTFSRLKSTAKGVVRKQEFKSIQSNGSQTLHSSAFVLGADIHAFIAAAKFCVDRPVISVHSTSIKENAVPETVTVTYVDDSVEGELVEYDRNLSRMMTAIASIGSLHLPIIPSKFGSSICPNILKITDNIELTIDIRAMLESPESHRIMADQILDNFKRVGLEGSVEITASIDPVFVDPQSFLPQKLKEVAEESGMRIIDVGEKLGGASDTRFFTSIGIPGVELGPEGKNEHGPNEFVRISSIHKLVEIFQRIFHEIV